MEFFKKFLLFEIAVIGTCQTCTYSERVDSAYISRIDIPCPEKKKIKTVKDGVEKYFNESRKTQKKRCNGCDAERATKESKRFVGNTIET